jgi:hypothetical protein
MRRPGAISNEPEVESRNSGVRSQKSGARSQEPNLTDILPLFTREANLFGSAVSSSEE